MNTDEAVETVREALGPRPKNVLGIKADGHAALDFLREENAGLRGVVAPLYMLQLAEAECARLREALERIANNDTGINGSVFALAALAHTDTQETEK